MNELIWEWLPQSLFVDRTGEQQKKREENRAKEGALRGEEIVANPQKKSWSTTFPIGML